MAQSPENNGRLRVELLGGFRVTVDDRVISDASWRPKAAQVVKLLGLTPGHRIHRDELSERMWPEFTFAAATNNLHRTLYAARRTLEPELSRGLHSAFLRLHGETLLLVAAAGLWVDVEAFEIASAGARRSADPDAYERALALYTGELLPEDRYADWAAAKREALCDAYLVTLLGFAELTESGDPAAAEGAFQRALTIEPANEQAHVGLIRLYAQAGNRRQALRQYQRLQLALRDDLGAEPDLATQRLVRTIESEGLSGLTAAATQAAAHRPAIASRLAG